MEQSGDGMNTSGEAWDERGIVRIEGGRRFERPDQLIKEEAYRLCINGRHVHTFACTPAGLEELAAGYAVAEGLLTDTTGIHSIAIDTAGREIRLSLREQERAPAAQPPRPRTEAAFSAQAIFRLWDDFNERCGLFRLTGAVHAMALTDGTEILLLHEDVARHNAAAKAIGGMFFSKISPSGTAFMFSGRLAAKIVAMVERSGVTALFCHGAVTAEAASRAHKAGITLAGFLRPGSMNIYTHSERIIE